MSKQRLAARFALAATVALVALSGPAAQAAGDGRHDCAELAACCAKIDETGTREECQKQASRKNDGQCHSVFPAFKPYCEGANPPKPEPKPKPKSALGAKQPD